ANGHANDLASTVLIATDKPVLMAPAMNPKMWSHPATRRNRATLRKDGVAFVGPAKGEMAESNEAGEGRMVVGFAAETQDLVRNAEAKLRKKGADFIVANDVSHESGVMGGDRNKVRIVWKAGVDEWPEMSKDEVATRLAALIAERLKTITV
ncbi:MAG: bifunctional phosphopantothenoylcysteine decarboxylase/phosphopantothenate synthase, partial [Mesorhizobium sp.]